MKRTPLLHADISHIIARMGHGDMLVIGDAGLPVPPGVRCIDLALMRGVPTLDQVLQAVLSELKIEQALIARESLNAQGEPPAWYLHHLQPLLASPAVVLHEEFKRRTQQACAIIRTGECTPYANVGLVSGVAF